MEAVYHRFVGYYTKESKKLENIEDTLSHFFHVETYFKLGFWLGTDKHGFLVDFCT